MAVLSFSPSAEGLPGENSAEHNKRELKGSLQSYLNSLKKFEELTQSEEYILIRLAQSGDDKARVRLIQANLSLVVSIARNYKGNGLDFMDLIQEGNLGLMKSIEKFDPERGCRFKTYSSWWIRESITRALSNKSRTIRIPVYLAEVVTKVSKLKEEYIKDHGRTPSKEEISKVSGISLKRVEAAMKYSRAGLSLDNSGDDKEASGAYSCVNDNSAETRLFLERLSSEMRKLVGTLTDREKMIIGMRFGLTEGKSRTLNDIARKLELSRDQVAKLSSSAMKKLRKEVTAHKNHYKDYLR